jgi:hypothetical protein
MTKKKVTRKKKSPGRKTRKRRGKPARKKKTTRPSKRSRPKKLAPMTRRGPLVMSLDAAGRGRRGLGAASAGQSGDTQGLSDAEDVDSESVEELVEEGQSFEAGVVAGVEDADARQSEVRSKQVREDDVPREYFEKD